MKTPKAEASMLYRTFIEANALRVVALEAGDSRADADAIVTGALRAAWPKGRDEPWHYVCEACSDTGWEMRTCQQDAGVCERSRVHASHDYVVPCWCAKGRGRLQSATVERDEVARIGRAPKKPARFGR